MIIVMMVALYDNSDCDGDDDGDDNDDDILCY
jgi:hypothetical protein